MTSIERIILTSLREEPDEWRCEYSRHLTNDLHGIRLVRLMVPPYRWTFVVGERLGFIPFGRFADLRIRWLVRGTRIPVGRQ